VLDFVVEGRAGGESNPWRPLSSGGTLEEALLGLQPFVSHIEDSQPFSVRLCVHGNRVAQVSTREMSEVVRAFQSAVSKKPKGKVLQGPWN